VTLFGVSQSLHQHYLRGGGRTSFARNLCLAITKNALHIWAVTNHKSQIAVSPLINLEMQHDGRSAQIG